MDYFESFPLLRFQNQYNIDPKVMVDITRRIKFRENILNGVALFEVYVIRDGDRPDTIADKYYRDPSLHWLVMLVNDRLSVYKDWPLSQTDLYKCMLKKYGSDSEMNKVKYYVDSRGIIVHETEPVLKTPVSFYDYEIQQNDAKRVIKLIRPELVSEIISQFQNEIIK